MSDFGDQWTKRKTVRGNGLLIFSMKKKNNMPQYAQLIQTLYVLVDVTSVSPTVI